MIDNLLINIAASLFIFIGGSISSYLYRLWKNTKPVKKLWKIHDPQNLIICAATSVNTDTGKYKRPATGIGQLRALGYTVESLSKAYDVHIHNILLSTDQVQRQIEKDIIILGGPKNNEITRMFLNKLPLSKNVVTQIENTIHWKVQYEENEFNASEENQKVTKDYGLILRGKNPFACTATPTTFCLFTGCHTYGTIAAAKYFTEEYVKQYKGFSNGPQNIAILVECDIMDGFPVGVSKIKEYEF